METWSRKRPGKWPRLENEKRIKKMRPYEAVLTDDEVVAQVDHISSLPLFRGQALNELAAPGPVDDCKMAFYFGYTAQAVQSSTST